MRIPVKLIKDEVIAIYGKEAAGRFLTSDAKTKEINDAIKECGTVIEFIPGPTKEQYELALHTYPQAFKDMPREYQTVQNSCEAVKGDIANLEHCALVDPEIIAAALTIPKLKTYHLKAITEYAARADYEPLLNEICFPKYIKAFPKQYLPLCTKFGRGRLAPLLKPADIAEILENDPSNVINLEIPIDDPIWQVVARKYPVYVFDLYLNDHIENLPYDLLLTTLMESNGLIGECDFNDSDHMSAIMSVIFSNPTAIQYVPKGRITDAMIMTAITVDPSSITCIPPDKMTSSMVKYVLEKDPNLIKYLYKNDIPVDLIVRAIESNFDNVAYLRMSDVTPVLETMCPGITGWAIDEVHTCIEEDADLIIIQDAIYPHLVIDGKLAPRWEKSIEVSMYRPSSGKVSLNITETEITQESATVEEPEKPKGDLEIIPLEGE